MNTASQLIRETTQLLRRTGLDTPRLEAEVLLSHAWGRTRTELLIYADQPVPEVVADNYRQLVSRRVEGHPIAYLTGEREFMSLSFFVTHAVLIPRQETELLVEYVLGWVKERSQASSVSGDRLWSQPLVADVGTGSGAIAVSLANYDPTLQLIAIDRSTEALAVAASNAESHSVAERITFLEGDLLQPVLEQGLQGQGIIVVANLPYIPHELLPTLPVDVQREPHLALDGGGDGLELYRRLIPQAVEFLTPGGLLACEIGYDQGEKLAKLLEDEGCEEVRIMRDYLGEERIVVGLVK